MVPELLGMSIHPTPVTYQRLCPVSLDWHDSTQEELGMGKTHANEDLNRGDAFTKREKANEDYTVRQREKEKLLDLKKKLAEQQKHLKQLEDHM